MKSNGFLIHALVTFGLSLAAAAGAGFAVQHLAPEMPAFAALGAEAGAMALAIAVILVPPAIAFDRSVRALSTQMAASASQGTETVWKAPAPLRGLADACREASTLWKQRCDDLTMQVRELEIRCSVIDAERRHYEAVLHSLKDAVIVTDAFNELAMANEPAARLLGFELGSAVHKPLPEVVRDDMLTKQISEVSQSGVLSKQKHFEHVIRMSENAPPSAFDVTLACLPDQNNSVGGVVAILRDVTREKEISEMKSDFVSQASHELRTPLSSINAYVEMLIDAEAQDEETRQEFYQIIKAEADRVSRMIDNMLNISRIEAGIVQAERTEVDFVKVVREVIETIRPQADAKSIKLIEKSGPLIYTAQADRDMMYQVVMNLVSNAIKYTPDEGRVTVSVENDDATRSVMVTVADTGLGIPPDAVERVFDKFYRIDNYKRVAKGTGLGLNLVKHIVETVHQGSVGVTSEVGMGSRFWFTVPYVSETA